MGKSDEGAAPFAHFAARVRERAPHLGDPFELAARVRQALQEGDETIIARVPGKNWSEAMFYRLFNEDGDVTGFVVVSENSNGLWPMTFYTTEMFRRSRAAAKRRKRTRAPLVRR